MKAHPQVRATLLFLSPFAVLPRAQNLFGNVNTQTQTHKNNTTRKKQTKKQLNK